MPRLILLVVAIFALTSCNAVPGDSAFRSGHYEAAFRLYESQYRLGDTDAGLRLAAMHAEGLGVPKNPREALKISSELAEKNIIPAWHNLGVHHEYGLGTPIDYQQAARWYLRAADAGYVSSMYNLGTLYANQYMEPADDIEGLAWLLMAMQMAKGESASEKFIKEDRPGHAKKMIARMMPEQVAAARVRAAAKLKSLERLQGR